MTKTEKWIERAHAVLAKTDNQPRYLTSKAVASVTLEVSELIDEYHNHWPIIHCSATVCMLVNRLLAIPIHCTAGILIEMITEIHYDT